MYLNLILFHVGIGFLVFLFPPFSKVYGYSIFILGAYIVIKTQNKNNQALMAAAYVVGSEVFLRMTGGNPLYEISKYGVMVFIFIGMDFSGFSKNATPYWLFLLLLVPSVVLTTFVLNYDTDIRNTIAFNISGPVCLGVASLYTFRRKIPLTQINSILLCMGLPIVSSMVYLTFYTPDIRDVITSTQSNHETSGGFGPNQVATVLGLGMFIFFSRIILESKTKYLVIINLIIALNITYRGMVTFSPWRMITGFLMIILLLFFLYTKSNYTGRVKLNYLAVLLTIALMVTWSYISVADRRAYQQALCQPRCGRKGERKPVYGQGGCGQRRNRNFFGQPHFWRGSGKRGRSSESQNRRRNFVALRDYQNAGRTRYFGHYRIVDFVLYALVFVFGKQVQHVFVVFCGLLVFDDQPDAAMRTAAPAFVYSLSLLNIYFSETPKKKGGC